MKAGNDGSAPLTYEQLDWGDLIYGTKDQLQELGLAVGLAFPGELSGPRRELKVRDARGFPTRIFHHNDDIYGASIPFPHWPESPGNESYRTWTPVCPGVTKREFWWGDQFRGSADDLAAAKLVRIDQLPGMPGMRKTRVTVYADGGVAGGPINANPEKGRRIDRQIERASKSTYVVAVYVPETKEQRHAVEKLAHLEWERHVRSLPRPARLQPISSVALQKMGEARIAAARDVPFQGMLARLVLGSARPSA